MQRRRHNRRSEKVGGGPDGDPMGQDCVEKVVHGIQRSHHAGRLRDPRWNESGVVLSIEQNGLNNKQFIKF